MADTTEGLRRRKNVAGSGAEAAEAPAAEEATKPAVATPAAAPAAAALLGSFNWDVAAPVLVLLAAAATRFYRLLEPPGVV